LCGFVATKIFHVFEINFLIWLAKRGGEGIANSSAMGMTMRAAVLEACNLGFRLMGVARPKVGARQVLVRIEASGVNPLGHEDSKRQFVVPRGAGRTFPVQ
jgi:hypothetical protein